MGSREILTLQFGGFANFVGAHFWNFQDELLGMSARDWTHSAAAQIDPDVLYAVGEDERARETYSPRLLACDLSGSLGGVSIGGAHLATGLPTVATWEGHVSVHVTERVPRTRFVTELEEEEDWEGDEGSHVTGVPNGHTPHQQDEDEADERLRQAARELEAEGAVRFWTDYLKASLHPRSVLQLPGLWRGVAAFSGFGEGHAPLGDPDFRERVFDRIRALAEGCDHLQGFQVFAEDLSGFGQMTHEVLAEVNDDYARAPVLLFSVRGPATTQEQEASSVRLHSLNEAVSLAMLPNVATLYVPLSLPPNALPGIRPGPRTMFEASGLLAAVIDTVTLPYRLSATPSRCPQGLPVGGVDLHSLLQLMVTRPRANLAALSAALPCPALPDEATLAARSDLRANHRDGPLPASSALPSQSWTPGVLADGAEELLAESLVLRGPRRGGAAVDSDTALSGLDSVLLAEGTRCVRHRCVVPQPLPIPLPFPSLFSSTVLRYGDVAASPMATSAPNQHINGTPQRQAGGVESMPVLARLRATSAFGDLAVTQRNRLKRIAGSQRGKALLGSWGSGHAEVEEMEESLHALAAAYNGGSDDEYG